MTVEELELESFRQIRGKYLIFVMNQVMMK